MRSTDCSSSDFLAPLGPAGGRDGVAALAANACCACSVGTCNSGWVLGRLRPIVAEANDESPANGGRDTTPVVYGRAPEMLELTDTLLSCAAEEASISTRAPPCSEKQSPRLETCGDVTAVPVPGTVPLSGRGSINSRRLCVEGTAPLTRTSHARSKSGTQQTSTLTKSSPPQTGDGPRASHISLRTMLRTQPSASPNLTHLIALGGSMSLVGAPVASRRAPGRGRMRSAAHRLTS